MSSDGLTSGQIEVANAFFDLVESQGFVVAGGAALLALGLSTRPTQDLDVFTAPPVSSVRAAFDAFQVQVGKRQWTVAEVTTADTFCRFVVDVGNEKVLVDLAIDSAQSEPATITVLGPTMAAVEVAARKLLALFDRGEARDFVDVYQLTKRFDRNVMLKRAAAIDLGFDREVFVGVMRSHLRFSDDELPLGVDEVDDLRAYFDNWSKQLTNVLESRNEDLPGRQMSTKKDEELQKTVVRLRSDLEEEIVEVDYWDSDRFAVGLRLANSSLLTLIYISNLDGSFFYEVEKATAGDPPHEVLERGEGIDYAELLAVCRKYFEIEFEGEADRR